MITSENCPHCKNARKLIIGEKNPICGYCMQSVKDSSGPKTEKPPRLHSLSLLYVGLGSMLGHIVLDLSILISFLVGLILGFFFLLAGRYVFFLFALMIFILLFAFLGIKIMEYGLYFIEQVILFFELRESYVLKDGFS